MGRPRSSCVGTRESASASAASGPGGSAGSAAPAYTGRVPGGSGAGQRAPGASQEDLRGASSGSARGSVGGTGAGAGKSGSVAWLQASSRSSGRRRTAEAGPGACPRTWPGQVLGTEEGFWGQRKGFAPAGTEGRYRQRGIFGRGTCCTAARTSVTDTQPCLCSFTPPPSVLYGQDGLVGLAHTGEIPSRGWNTIKKQQITAFKHRWPSEDPLQIQLPLQVQLRIIPPRPRHGLMPGTERLSWGDEPTPPCNTAAAPERVTLCRRQRGALQY